MEKEKEVCTDQPLTGKVVISNRVSRVFSRVLIGFNLIYRPDGREML
jgi:hypothetical protein